MGRDRAVPAQDRHALPSEVGEPATRPRGQSGYSGARAFDLIVLAVLTPLLLLPAALLALAVFLDSPGSVLYRARRIGQGGEPFMMLKLRTMRYRAGGALLSSAGDARVTPLGRFLRSSRLDELPQLWNVLRGQMRLVGPRPELEEFVELHREAYDEILTVPPGITGPTQLEFAVAEAQMLHGQEDPGRYYAEQVLPRKVRLDLAYVRGRGLPGDLGLLLATAVLPLRLAAGRVAAAFDNRRRSLASYLLPAAGIAVLLICFLVASGSAR